VTAPDIRIYVTATCPYCRAAVALLDGRGAPYQKIDCSEDAATRDWLVEKTGRRTVPQIFIGDVPVGGYDDLKRLDKLGALDPILRGEAAPPSVI
jgi:glutaredoxin 3